MAGRTTLTGGIGSLDRRIFPRRRRVRKLTDLQNRVDAAVRGDPLGLLIEAALVDLVGIEHLAERLLEQTARSRMSWRCTKVIRLEGIGVEIE